MVICGYEVVKLSLVQVNELGRYLIPSPSGGSSAIGVLRWRQTTNITQSRLARFEYKFGFAGSHVGLSSLEFFQLKVNIYTSPVVASADCSLLVVREVLLELLLEAVSGHLEL